MRDYIYFFLNGEEKKVQGEDAFLPFSTYLREKNLMCGTKVVCSEGDCGACTLLVANPTKDKKQTPFLPINSCISPVYLLDGKSIVTIEGINSRSDTHPIQEAMMKCHGQQCGFCTPGIIMSLAGEMDQKEVQTEKKIKNALTGNLCRCTGYVPIIEAGVSADLKTYPYLKEDFLKPDYLKKLQKVKSIPVLIKTKEMSFFSPTQINSAIKWKAKQKGVRIINSGTDIGVFLNKGKDSTQHFLGLNLIPKLYEIKKSKNAFIIGAKVNIHDTINALEKDYPRFCESLNIFASPQIKNMATIVGNVANASPIGDSIPFLCVVDAEIILSGAKQRKVNINNFFTGYRKIDIKKGEIISAIKIPILKNGTKTQIYKVSTRKDLDISCVSMAATINFTNSRPNSRTIDEIKLAFGGVGATVLRAKKTELFLKNKPWNLEVIEEAIPILKQEFSPISDHRATKEVRLILIGNLMRKLFYDFSTT